MTLAAIYSHEVDNNIELVAERIHQNPDEIDKMLNVVLQRFLEK